MWDETELLRYWSDDLGLTKFLHINLLDLKIMGTLSFRIDVYLDTAVSTPIQQVFNYL